MLPSAPTRFAALLALTLLACSTPVSADAWTDAALVASAVAGNPSRDALAYQMLALGYSARETADVVTGRISRHALDTARRLIAAGHSRDVAADYLDREYRRADAAAARRGAPARKAPGAQDGTFGPLIARSAALHGVDAAVVRAVMEVESALNPAARSPAGAIGLMQLMPGTARELGVNPFVVAENIDGGVRYLAQQLKTFGRLDLALVAYNAGPGFARRYAAGAVPLYGETRQYLSRVLRRLHTREDPSMR